MNNINKKIDEEIASEIDNLSYLEKGTEQYKIAMDGIIKLTDKSIELQKLEASVKKDKRDYEIRMKELELNSEKNKNDFDIRMEGLQLDDKKLKVEQDKNEVDNINKAKSQKIQTTISIVTIAVPALLTIWGTCKSLKFEETGTITTPIGKGFINRLFPKN